MNDNLEIHSSKNHCNGVSQKLKPQEKGNKGLVDIITSGTRQIWNKKVPGTQKEKFQNIIEKKYGVKFETHWDLHEWSVKNYSKFWEEVWNFFEVIYSKPYIQGSRKTGNGMMDIEWFPGARLNYAENLLRYRDDKTALICADENGNEETVTYAQLFEKVKLYAAAFKKAGLQIGDKVACYLSNRPEAIYTKLAVTSIGAMFGGPLVFYSAKGVSGMINSIKPKFLIAVDSFRFNQKEHDILQRLPEIANGIESIEKVIIVPTTKDSKLKDISSINKSCFLDEFLEEGRATDGTVPDLVFEQLPFDHPAFINFTSGSTGAPKSLVHSGGTFLPVIRDFGLHDNLDRSSVLISIQPVGWNVWNLHVGSLALGCTLLIYDGNPYFQTRESFWDMLNRHKVSFCFNSTVFIDRLERSNIVPKPDCKLEHLKLFSMGACPVKLQNVDFLLKKVKSDLFVGCLYGTTETMGTYSGFDFNMPVYSGMIQCPALGVDFQIFDEEGCSVVGKVGEVVVTTPLPSLPIFILNDENGTKMREAYFSKFPGVWTQNDEAYIDPVTKGIIVTGRSDDSIKQQGKKFYPVEIYAVIHDITEIADYICVGQSNHKGYDQAVLFVKMKDGCVLNQEIISKIEQKITEELTVFCVPKVIIPVTDIPYNWNGKRLEKAVKKIVSTNQRSEILNIRNPECLQQYYDIPEILEFQKDTSQPVSLAW